MIHIIINGVEADQVRAWSLRIAELANAGADASRLIISEPKRDGIGGYEVYITVANPERIEPMGLAAVTSQIMAHNRAITGETELAAQEWTDWECPLCGEVLPHIDSAAHLELGHDARREYRERKFPIQEGQ